MKALIGRIERISLSSYLDSTITYDRSYTITSLILMFFTFSCMGWMWEVAIHIFQDGVIVNRGVMNGPWLPIYGVGGIVMITVLKRWHTQPLRLMIVIMFLCGTMEYITSSILKQLFGVVWWDYSDLRFQLHGKVSLAGLMIFGIGGLFLVYIGAPFLDTRYHKFSKKLCIALCIGLGILFAIDLVYSSMYPNMGLGITK